MKSKLIIHLLFLGLSLMLPCVASVADTGQYSTRTPHWTFDSHAYMSAMALTSQMQIDGVVCDTAYEIGAFCGNECRGAALASWQPAVGRFVTFLGIMGNDGDSIHFRLYDHRHNIEIKCDSIRGVKFSSTDVLGKPSSPVILNFCGAYLHKTDAWTESCSVLAGKWDATLFAALDCASSLNIDMTAVSSLPSERPLTKNSHALIYVNETLQSQLTAADNVVVRKSAGKDLATHLSLTEGCDFSPISPITATSVSYSCNLRHDGNHQPICLPFTPDVIPSSYAISKYDKIQDNTAYFITVNNWIAGKAYMIKYLGNTSSDTETVTFSAQNVEVLSKPLDEVFHGVYVSSNIIVGSVYGIDTTSGTERLVLQANSYMPPSFSAYFAFSTTEPSSIGLAFDYTSGIDGLRSSSATSPIYNLQGIRIDNPYPNGVYIRNGHKFLSDKK